MTPRPHNNVDSIGYKPYKTQKQVHLGLWSLRCRLLKILGICNKSCVHFISIEYDNTNSEMSLLLPEIISWCFGF